MSGPPWRPVSTSCSAPTTSDENEARLREIAADIHDESDRLGGIPATAAVEER